VIKELDKVIHQPVRTKIMAQLINMGVCDYTTLKKTLELSDGHMSTHMRELLESGYVEMEKAFVDNKPRTTYKLTKDGKKRFAEYVDTLKQLIALK
jgi:DNA-binding HxlR family transcriptional regulator